ncbi:MAG TPA: response regulator [candidate division Zixibacteria bacterium]|nr:response regulator [candidate division Zixibacteria bacterium]
MMHEQPSILVVDDELLIRDLLYDFFAGQGWQIAIADTGEKALGILKEKEIDLVLTDLRMPQMDGLDLARLVREEHPDMPVVIMTGFPSVESAVAALRSKISDYVTKPFNINELFRIIKSHIDKDVPQQ